MSNPELTHILLDIRKNPAGYNNLRCLCDPAVQAFARKLFLEFSRDEIDLITIAMCKACGVAPPPPPSPRG